MSVALTTPDHVESPQRRRLHLVIGSIVVTLLYCGAVFVLRNAVG